MGVSKNRGTPKSSILIGFSIINHPFWGTPIVGKTPYMEILWTKPLVETSWCFIVFSSLSGEDVQHLPNTSLVLLASSNLADSDAQAGSQQGSVNYLFGGDQPMQMYGKFEGFPLNSALFGLAI